MSNTAKTNNAAEQATPSAANPKTASQRSDSQTSPAKVEAPPSNTVKDPDEWTTGGETMTGAQASYLKTLSEEAGETFDDTLSKADASKRIDELQSSTGRGRNH